MIEIATVGIRFALYVDLMLLFGVPLFGLYALRGPERASGSVLPFRRLIGPLALAGLFLSILSLLLLAAAMSGVAPTEVDRESIGMIVTGTSIGTAWQVRIIALLASAWLAFTEWRRPAAVLTFTAASAAVALGSLAWTGHGAADEGPLGWVHLIADIVHLLAAGVWIGALVALTMLLFRPSTAMTAEHVILSHRALDGFSAVGALVVGLIVVSGLINSLILVGPANVLALPRTLYGQLLIAKLVLFVGMLGLAASNRFRLTPALATSLENGEHKKAIEELRRSLVVESALAVAILAAVAWMGLLAPPATAGL